MKKILLFLLVMSIHFLQAQEIDDVRKLDTVYVLFEADKNQTKIYTKNNDNSGYYFFNGDDIFFGKNERGIYQYSSKDPFNKIWKPSNDRYVDKSFLLKHKSEIIDFQFFKKLAEKNISFVDFEEREKVYYIIDKADFKKNKIKLTEVNPPLIVME
jgi:hypothetical protein